ncbi:MAG: 6-phosphogluconolactonase [Akkermansiaceae bacterium]|nr:6-phosphogluconolactonase [Akkermansiaceae bacterium]MCF7732660.1 6-phosphogluconolactonase [Akkermansiaceae bacterium]
MSRCQIECFPDDESLAAAVAAGWCAELAGASSRGTAHTVALSGGRVSLRVFDAMVAMAAGGRLDPAPARFFWADERCVPPVDPQSNYLEAETRLLKPLGIAAENIHRIRGEIPPEQAAAEAAAALRKGAGGGSGEMPVLDLVLLGMGEDGHVASLFPGDEISLSDRTSWFRPVLDSPKPPPCRVTLGMGPILAAREVWVVVAGAGKEEALRASLSPTGDTPLARVIRGRERTRILSTVRPG